MPWSMVCLPQDSSPDLTMLHGLVGGIEPAGIIAWKTISHRIHGAGIYIYANIWGILMVNVTIYSIHGSYGYITVGLSLRV